VFVGCFCQVVGWLLAGRSIVACRSPIAVKVARGATAQEVRGACGLRTCGIATSSLPLALLTAGLRQAPDRAAPAAARAVGLGTLLFSSPFLYGKRHTQGPATVRFPGRRNQRSLPASRGFS